MEKTDFALEQFRTLRAEIAATKARLFFVVCLGLVAIPWLTYLAEQPGIEFVAPILPFAVLVITMIFVAEEEALMRCGRFIREHVESSMQDSPGWESWIEKQPRLRFMDKCLFACLLLTFFVFYFASSSMAIEKLMTLQESILPGQESSVAAICGGVLYGIGALWMIITVMTHWRSATATTPKM